MVNKTIQLLNDQIADKNKEILALLKDVARLKIVMADAINVIEFYAEQGQKVYKDDGGRYARYFMGGLKDALRKMPEGNKE